MLFQIKNIGLIKEASIEIKGLTVLAGLNDVGKSFIGRTIFSIIKTVSQSEEQMYSYKIERVEKQIDRIYVSLRRALIEQRRNIRDIFNPLEILQNIVEKERVLDWKGLDDYFNSLKQKINTELFTSPKSDKNRDNLHTFIDSSFDELLSLIKEESDKEKSYSRFFDTLIQTEFQNQINRENNSSIFCSEGKIKLLNVEIKNNKTTSFQVFDTLYFDNVTLIESPIILQLANILTTNLAFPRFLNRRNILGRPDLASHITDLLYKIQTKDIGLEILNEVIMYINDIIKGKVYYDEKQNSHIFEKSDGFKIKPINVAHGIKTFGLIQLLINSGSINQKSILIIDEPEVHLHPEWQYRLAELIIMLVKSDVPVLISSHSPYMIKALQTFAERNQLSEVSKFYFGSKLGNNSAIFEDVTENLEPIYNTLAKPMQQINLSS